MSGATILAYLGLSRKRVPEPLRSLLLESRSRVPHPAGVYCGCGTALSLADHSCPGCGIDAIHAAPWRSQSWVAGSGVAS
jgi:hypothetical protein